MILKPPFEIGPSLLPMLRVPCHTGEGRDAMIEMECIGVKNNRLVWRWHIDLPDGSAHEACDISSGVQDTDSPADTQKVFGALLAFLTAAAESYRYNEFDWDVIALLDDCNASMFPRPVVEWAYCHQDELETLREEIECEQNRGKLLLASEDD